MKRALATLYVIVTPPRVQESESFSFSRRKNPVGEDTDDAGSAEGDCKSGSGICAAKPPGFSEDPDPFSSLLEVALG